MNKKAIAILGAIFLLIVGTLGFLIYTKYGKKTDAPTTLTSGGDRQPPQTSTTTSPVVTPPVNPPVQTSGQFNKLVNGPVVSPALFFRGNGITYSDPKGQLYQVGISTSTGPVQVLGSQPADIEARPNLNKVIWPGKGDNFIAQFSDSSGQNIWSFYNLYSHSYSDLPPQVEAFDWLPSGEQIYYIWLDNGKATLNIGDPDAKNWQYITDMWETDDQISVSPDGKNILYYEKNSPNSSNPINMTTPDGRTWKVLVKDGYNLGALWSPDSQKFLFGKKDSSGAKYQLWYYNLLTSEVKYLQLDSIPEKAVWGSDSKTVYVSVPKSGAAGGDSLTQDIIYKVDTGNVSNNKFDPGSNLSVDGRDLFLGKDEKTLFFRNAQDGALYYLNLSQ